VCWQTDEKDLKKKLKDI
jgi:hypothetical protein